MKTTKVKSFTIIELLVVMALSGIVMVICLWFYISCEKMFYSISDGQTYKTTLYRYIGRMRSDIDRSDYIEFNNHRFALYYNDSLFCQYLLEDEDIIRKDRFNSDTLEIELRKTDTVCLFSRRRILIKDIHFEIKVDQTWMMIYLHKDYYSRFLYHLDEAENRLN
jgi:prepilin-type N-terminal cleavage/methylation domain-containing protein